MSVNVPRTERAEAEGRAGTLEPERPDRGIYRWIARADGDSWERPQPQPAEDPRPAHVKNTGGPWVGGV